MIGCTRERSTGSYSQFCVWLCNVSLDSNSHTKIVSFCVKAGDVFSECMCPLTFVSVHVEVVRS